MRDNIANSSETVPRRRELVKFLLFAITILAPMIFFALQSGRVVWQLFLLFLVGLFYFSKSPFLWLERKTHDYHTD